MSRARRCACLVAAASSALLTAACGGSSKPTSTSGSSTPGGSATTAAAITPYTAPAKPPAPKSDLTKVVGNSQHYTFPSVVPPAQYPAVVLRPLRRLRPGHAGRTVATSGNNECIWTQSGVSDLNAYKVSFTLDNVSSEAAGDYMSAQQTNAGNNPTAVAGIGQQAFIYSLGGTGIPDPRITVLTAQADFDVALTPPGESAITPDQAAAIVTAAAKAIAPEFA